ncbi:MAG: ImuA protein [Hyphomicrobiaceae bacterium]|nr:ImuA protein [Hyphomicrobiaceae bacterium]
MVLPRGALNEVVAAHGDRPAAFGFLFALTALGIESKIGAGAGPAIFIAARRTLAEFGAPYGHGLVQLGLDLDRLVLIEAETDKEALWALEETLRSEVRPVVVAGVLAGGLDLTSSRRLNLAAGPQRTPLVLLTGAMTSTMSAKALGTSAAATRWRIAASPAARDRFGALAAPRWHAVLERCRIGSSMDSPMGPNMDRPGAWVIEWDHVTHRFRVVEGLADRPPVAVAGLRRAG